MNRLKLLAPLCVLLLLGCAPAPGAGSSPNPSTVAPGADFTVPLGQIRAVADLEVGFDSVLSDSRCKPGVQCVWEGDAVVAVSLRGTDGDRVGAELHSNAKFPRTADHAGHRVELVSLNAPGDEVTLRVLPTA